MVALVALVGAGEIVARLAGLGAVSSGTRTPAQAAFNDADMFEALPGEARRYRNRPGAAVLVGDVEYRHDALGLRVTGETSPPEDDRPRVLFVGDSTTYGWGVAADDALPRRVARTLGERIVALNAGTSGYTTGQELAAYRALAPELRPDLVVLVVYPNDVTDGALRWDPGLDVLYLDETPTPDALKPLLWRSALYRAAVAAHTRVLAADGATSPDNLDNVAFVVEPLRELAAEVAATGSELVVALLPALETLDPYLFAAQHAAISQAARAEGLATVDLLDSFLAERETVVAAYEIRSGKPAPATARRDFLHQYWVAESDHHLNSIGNEIAARGMAQTVAEALDLPFERP